jgi:hypothetical protein
MLAKLRNYRLYPKYIFEQAFYRLILLIQKNEKINILLVPFIILNFPPSPRTKKGSDEWHFDHFTIIFWVKCTFTFILEPTFLLFFEYCRKFKRLLNSKPIIKVLDCLFGRNSIIKTGERITWFFNEIKNHSVSDASHFYFGYQDEW